MNKTIKKTISSFLILAFLLNVVLPIKEAYAMTTPWWSGSQATATTNISSPPTGEGSNLIDNGKNQEEAGEPVLIHNGDFVYEHPDLNIPSRGINTEINRTYKSQSRYNNRFGYGWDISYNKRIIPLCTGDLYYLNGGLNRYIFTYIDGTNYTSPKGIYDTIVQNQDGTWTLTEPHKIIYEFNQNGVLTQIKDRNNNTLYFEYDQTGKLPIIGTSVFSNDPDPKIIAYDYKLIKITDTVGRELILSYDDNGRLTTITDSFGRVYSYSYDASINGDLLTFTTPQTEEFPQSLTTTYTYQDHNLETITDAKGQTYLTNYYDSSDRVYQQDYGQGRFIFSYDSSTQTTITDPKGFVTVWTFDSNGNPTTKKEYTAGLRPTDPAYYTTTYTYNNNLERTSIAYPKANGIKYTFDESNSNQLSKGNLLEIRRKSDMSVSDNNQTDLITAFTYDSRFNFIKTITDPKGNITAYTYDYELSEEDPNYSENGNLIKITYPIVSEGTPQVHFTYNTYGQVETIIDPNGIVTKYEYYPDTGYLKKITQDYQGLSSATQFAYDAYGNIDKVTDPNSHTTDYDHNPLNQLVKITSPTPFNYVTKYTYDENGNLKQIDRQANEEQTKWQATKYSYNIFDQLQTITDPLDKITTFTYDANGNRESITDAENNITTYKYDERNLLWKTTEALNNTTEYSYDYNGNLEIIKDANTNLTQYLYDGFDRLKTTTYADTSTENYTYDVNSNLISKKTPKDDLIKYTYDTLNRLDIKTYPDTLTIDYTYDIGSRLTNITDTNGAISYVYDVVNRVVSVDNYGKSTGYDYDAAGNRIKLIYPDSSFVAYEYDELNRLTNIKDQDSNVIASYAYDALSRRTNFNLLNGTFTTYAYDGINRLTNLTNSTNSPIDYVYDAVGNRLAKADIAGIEGYAYDDIYQLISVGYPVNPDQSYEYDAVGSREKLIDGELTTTYQSNNLNQYTLVGAIAYAYDNNGSLISDGVNSYGYDYENRLISANGNGNNAAYEYDDFGRRISKTANGVTAYFVYDGDQIIEERDSNDQLIAKYVYGDGIDEALRMSRNSTDYYYHYDGLGSVTNLTNSTGSTIENYSYDVYGQPNQISSIGNRFYFTGREFDVETGIYHYRNRAYSPTIGRFLQRDPLGYFDNLNLYSYANNNPTNFIDPYGEFAWLPLIGLAIWFVLSNPDTANAPKTCDKTYSSTGTKDMLSDAGASLALGLAFMGLKYAWSMRPYWRYYTAGTETTSKWMTRSWGWWKPYRYGEQARRALNLPRENLATAVKRISVKSVKTVVGPRHPKPQPLWEWFKEGEGWEFYGEANFPAN